MQKITRPSRPSFVQHHWATPKPNNDLGVILADEIVKGQTLWKDKVRNYFLPSRAGTTCSRSISISTMGHQVPFSALQLRRFRVGNNIEEGIVSDMQSAGILVASDIKVSLKTPVPFWGFADAEVRMPGEDEVRLVEIKSINSHLYRRLPKVSGDPAENTQALFQHQPNYVAQWTIYAKARGRTRGFLFYEEKDAHSERIFDLIYMPAIFDGIVKVHQSAYVHTQKRRIAPVPPDRNPNSAADKTCGKCYAQYLCRELPVEGVDYDTMRDVDERLRGRRN